ncbi:carbon-nitrogen hydrolase family protein [Nocardioides yefusunii]|uniref:Carbon-nitrogen hydrolase family protein n=1 Tax=Nocardioides yefusunii TaxID=2500546 RepID=A0ABW1R1F6_9ACTN|nr:carbon-nitrogen hydrolase family protein [Nocardioides yefusunii]
MAEHSTADAGRLHVVLVQAASSLDPSANAAALRDLVDRAAAEARERNPLVGEVLVVLPEVFQRDFGKPDTDLAAFAEPLDGEFVGALTAAAVEHGVSVVAGMFRAVEGGRPLNTLVLRRPDGTGVEYDKIHLYDSFGYKESDRLAAGEWKPVTVTVGGLRLGLMTCYDLRFPELARALVDDGADAIIVPAAWVAGDRKVDHWRTLTKARAIENTAYVVAVGQPAQRYSGHSLVVSPLGDVLVEADAGKAEEPTLLHAVLQTTDVTSARSVNPSLANRRR